MLLSRTLRCSIIAAEALNRRVRDGNGCFVLAMVTSPKKGNCTGSRTEASGPFSVCVLFRFCSAWGWFWFCFAWFCRRGLVFHYAARALFRLVDFAFFAFFFRNANAFGAFRAPEKMVVKPHG